MTQKKELSDAKRMLNYRKQKFKVEVEPHKKDQDWYDPGTVLLRLTTNGIQWQYLTLMPNERMEVIVALLKSMEVSDA